MMNYFMRISGTVNNNVTQPARTGVRPVREYESGCQNCGKLYVGMKIATATVEVVVPTGGVISLQDLDMN